MISLHKPTAREILDIRADQATVNDAHGVISAMNVLAKKLTTESAVVVARKLYPGLPDRYAIAELQKAIADATSEIGVFALFAHKVTRAEMERLGPTISKAMYRMTEIQNKTPCLKSTIASSAIAVAKKKQALTDAGVSLEEATRATGDCGAAAAQAELASLTADVDPINKFLRTLNEADLPAGFVQPAATPNQGNGCE